MKYLVTLLMLTGCAVRLDVPPIKTEVEVRHSVDFSGLLPYFEAKCKRELGITATPEEIKNCVDLKVAVILDFIISL